VLAWFAVVKPTIEDAAADQVDRRLDELARPSRVTVERRLQPMLIRPTATTQRRTPAQRSSSGSRSMRR
jgi:hypothetical protein